MERVHWPRTDEIGVLWYSRENKFEILIFDLLEFDRTIGFPATLYEQVEENDFRFQRASDSLSLNTQSETFGYDLFQLPVRHVELARNSFRGWKCVSFFSSYFNTIQMSRRFLIACVTMRNTSRQIIIGLRLETSSTKILIIGNNFESKNIINSF